MAILTKKHFIFNLSLSIILIAFFVQRYYGYLFLMKHDVMGFFGQINDIYTPFYPAIVRNTSQIPYEWTHILRENYKNILKEFETFQNKHENFDKLQFDKLIPSQQFLNRDSKWLAVILRCYGHETHLSYKYFPQTMKVIQETDKFIYLHHVMISMIKAQKSIPQHWGYYRGILRYHLSLSIPQHKHKDLHLRLWPNTSFTQIIQGNEDKYEMITWHNGSDVIFDDTNRHSVHNNVNQTRIILFVDFERPDLSLFQTFINRIVLFATSKISDICPYALKRQTDILTTK